MKKCQSLSSLSPLSITEVLLFSATVMLLFPLEGNASTYSVLSFINDEVDTAAVAGAASTSVLPVWPVPSFPPPTASVLPLWPVPSFPLPTATMKILAYR